MKIVVLDGHTLNPGDLSWEPLAALGELQVYDRTDSFELAVDRIGDAEILLVNKFPVNKALLDRCPGIRCVCVLATGYNVVDCAETRARGIPVCNVPTYGTAAVAQFTMALILSLCHRAEHHNQSVHDGHWAASPDFCYWLTPQTELAGKTLGILGYGRIGQAVANLARAFGMEVITCSRSQKSTDVRYVNLEELLSQSDILSLHCPLFPETEGIINRENLAKMKDGAILINTSRGALIDEEALAEALHTGKLRGAAVDVVSREPIVADNPLLTAPNCIITPHIAWAPLESRQRLMDIVVSNVKAFFAGTPQNVVNK